MKNIEDEITSVDDKIHDEIVEKMWRYVIPYSDNLLSTERGKIGVVCPGNPSERRFFFDPLIFVIYPLRNVFSYFRGFIIEKGIRKESRKTKKWNEKKEKKENFIYFSEFYYNYL